MISSSRPGTSEKFLKEGNKAKVTMIFRGREVMHTDLGRKLLDRLAEDLKETAIDRANAPSGRKNHGYDPRPQTLAYLFPRFRFLVVRF